jgi:hypothetical protein
MAIPHQGIYEALLDKDLKSILQLHPELRPVFGKLDPEEEPARYNRILAASVTENQESAQAACIKRNPAE